MTNIQLGLNNAVGTEYDNRFDGYESFESYVHDFFNYAVNTGKKLFTTNVEGLFDLYLENLPPQARQHYNCNDCRHFFNRFGGLVIIDTNGKIRSAMWNETQTPPFFLEAVMAMKRTVESSRVTGVFVPESRQLGTPKSGGWSHLYVDVPRELMNTSRLQSPYQVMAEKKEDFKMLMNAILQFNVQTVDTALTLLKTESLYRSEKVLGVAEWFKGIHEQRNKVKNSRNKENIVWLAVANAPVGFCHVRSSMVGTLLEDIASGMSFQLVSKRFKEKMDPLQYQRPQVAPKTGSIVRANKIFAELGLEPSLDRRFARVEELETAWKPKEKKLQSSSIGTGAFSHLQPKDTKPERTGTLNNAMETTMTWEKFARTVLPLAESIDAYLSYGRNNLSAILTAVYKDAPPILQWDKEEQRNPFSWYVYNGGSVPRDWNLEVGYTKVTGITYQPSMWHEENPHQGKGVFFILEGAKDTRYRQAGNALFPETMKSELREVRSVIEAYSKGATLEGYEEASACGLRMQYGNNNDWNLKLRVKTSAGVSLYKIDRWD
jgi:hypothetical protein